MGSRVLPVPPFALHQSFVPGQEQSVVLLDPVPCVFAFFVLQVEVDVELHQQVYQLLHALQHALLEDDVHQRVPIAVLAVGVEVAKFSGVGPEEIQQMAEEIKTDVSWKTQTKRCES